MGNVDQQPGMAAMEPHVEPVLEHVLRVFLERAQRVQLGVLDDQPAQMPPEEADQGAVRIGPLVGMLVMHPVDRDPSARRTLE